MANDNQEITLDLERIDSEKLRDPAQLAPAVQVVPIVQGTDKRTAER